MCYLVALGVTRTIRVLQFKDILGGGQGLEVRGRHIHHYTWGLLLLALQAVAHIPIGDSRRAVAIGVGIALIVDEFDIILGIEQWRFAQRDRPVTDAVLAAAGVAAIAAGQAKRR